MPGELHLSQLQEDVERHMPRVRELIVKREEEAAEEEAPDLLLMQEGEEDVAQPGDLLPRVAELPARPVVDPLVPLEGVLGDGRF